MEQANAAGCHGRHKLVKNSKRKHHHATGSQKHNLTSQKENIIVRYSEWRSSCAANLFVYLASKKVSPTCTRQMFWHRRRFGSGMSSILQWRKLCTKSGSDKGIPRATSSRKDEGLNESTTAEQGLVLHGKVKKSKKDCSPEKRTRLKQRNNEKDMHNVARSSNDKTHIVRCKKAQYTHLISCQKVMPKDEGNCPIVYHSAKKNGRKELAALWLAPFRVDDDWRQSWVRKFEWRYFCVA